MSDNQLLSSHPPLKVTFCKTALLLFQSMKKLQKSTLQGCQKKGFLCTLRQVYIKRSTHCSHFPSETPHLLLLSSFDTITHLGHHSMTRIWKVLRFSYNRHQRWFVCVKHCLMRGSLDPNIDPKTSVQIPEKGYEYNFKCIFKG